MPIFKAGGKLVYYAHVPKCAGSALEVYVHERFGDMAMLDQSHTGQSLSDRWSRTSPQHIDVASLNRLFPAGFFDVVFTIVRHPVARMISAYHFQLEVEKLVPANTGFSEWLMDIEDRMSEERFLFDNHTLPMSDIVPDSADVFYLEHGLDALVPFFDTVVGNQDAPRAIPKVNERGAFKGAKDAAKAERAQPADADLDRIARMYARDFERFGYTLGEKLPAAEQPVLTPELIAARDRENARRASPVARLAQKVARKLNH